MQKIQIIKRSCQFSSFFLLFLTSISPAFIIRLLKKEFKRKNAQEFMFFIKFYMHFFIQTKKYRTTTFLSWCGCFISYSAFAFLGTVTEIGITYFGAPVFFSISTRNTSALPGLTGVSFPTLSTNTTDGSEEFQ